jgi:pimeloyl-ACP methyl ester carboxylesterase
MLHSSALFAAGTWLIAQPAVPQVPDRAQAAPRFEESPCPFKADSQALGQVRCGYVNVQENRASPNSRQLKIAVAIVRSLSPAPRPDPIVIVAGGPGTPAIALRLGSITRGTLDSLRADRAVIVYDQRGAGYSDPAFCPGVEIQLDPLVEARAADPREMQRGALARCGDAMRSMGWDLSQYNSAVSALDLDDVRRALGYRQWNLLGRSYGARLVLHAMRLTPQGIRTVVLDGPSPPNRSAWLNRPADFADALHRLSAACAAQPACNAAYPDVEQTLWQRVRALQREPRTVQVMRPDGTPDTVRMTGSLLVSSVYSALNWRALIPVVPMLIYEVHNDTVTRALSRQLLVRSQVSWGMHYTVECFEVAPLQTPEMRAQLQRAHPIAFELADIFDQGMTCHGLHAFRARSAHLAPVASNIPTLIVTGEFDTATHRSGGPLVARTLRNSRVVEIPGAGHAESLQHECTRTMMRDFFNDPQRTIDSSCLGSIPPLRFITDVRAIVGRS